jgi:hypothetical protein
MFDPERRKSQKPDGYHVMSQVEMGAEKIEKTAKTVRRVF